MKLFKYSALRAYFTTMVRQILVPEGSRGTPQVTGIPAHHVTDNQALHRSKNSPTFLNGSKVLDAERRIGR